MGELAGDYIDSHESKIAQDNKMNKPDGKVETDVAGVFADGEKEGMPVFNVSKDEFYQNMNYGRKRIRFNKGTSTQQYMRNTKYNRPFWIKDNLDGYIRKIK